MTANGTRQFSTPAGVRLCPVEAIADGAARNFVLALNAGRFHGFVVRKGREVTGYVDRCPHAGLPLARALDDYLAPDGSFISCDWHGALFRIVDGTCVAGPCAGQALTRWPVTIDQEDWIVTT